MTDRFLAMTNARGKTGIRAEISALKRERTLAAAVDLFYEAGYENTTLEAVAERLGVTKPFIYSHFRSKAELLAEICARGISQSLNAMNSVTSLDVSATEKLKLLARRFVIAVLEAQKFIAIFSREEKNLSPEDLVRINDMRRDFDRKLTSLLRQGVVDGEFDVSDPHIAALAIGGMVSWAYVWYRPSGRLELDQVAEQMANLILAMVTGTLSPREGRSPAETIPA
jgi:AcrR family transcriptional regulator